MTLKQLEKIMNDKKITQSDLARMIGKGRSTVNKWFTGVSHPNRNTMDKIKKALNIEEIENNITSKISDEFEKIAYVPILSYVQAGEFSDLSHLNSDELEYIPLPASEVPHNAFLMKVKGDSMVYDYSPTQRLKMEYSKFSINENEFVLVDTNQTNIDCLIGKVMVAHNGHGTTVKLAYEEERGICLMPLNSRLQNNENIKRPSEARIIGKVIKVINQRNF